MSSGWLRRIWWSTIGIGLREGRWLLRMGAGAAGWVGMPDCYGSWVGLCEGRPALAWVGPDDAVSLEPQGVDSWFDRMTSTHGGLDVGGEWIERPWDLVSKNAEHLHRDFALIDNIVREQPSSGELASGPGRSAVDSRDGADRSVYGF